MCISKVRVNGYFVNCRKCPECVVKRQNEWIFRIKQEAKNHRYVYFNTFTYNDLAIPERVCAESGEITQTLKYKDLQDFFKRLRKKTNNLKYYAVGEYGEKTKRPHYHAIIMGVNYKHINELWNYGFVHTGDATHRAIRYTIKYMTKRLENTPEHAELPKACMSKGLGLDYVKKNAKFHYDRNQEYVIEEGGYKISLPEYYKKKIWDDPQKKGKIRMSWLHQAKVEYIKNRDGGTYMDFVHQEIQKAKFNKNLILERQLEKHSKSNII